MDRARSDCEKEDSVNLSDFDPMEGVIAELEHLEKICMNIVEKFSTPRLKICGTPQSKKDSEQVEMRGGVPNSFQPQHVLDTKGEYICGNSQEDSGETATNITSPSCVHLEGDVISTPDGRRKVGKQCPDRAGILSCNVSTSTDFVENETPSSFKKQLGAPTNANVSSDKPLLNIERPEQSANEVPSTNSFSVQDKDSMPVTWEKRKIQATGMTMHKRSRDELQSSSTELPEYGSCGIDTNEQAPHQGSNHIEELPSGLSAQKLNESNNDGENEKPSSSLQWKSTAHAKDAAAAATTVEPELSQYCEHKRMDFDEVIGFYM